MSAVYSADRCNFKEFEKAAQDLNWIGGDISSDRAQDSEPFGHFSFPIPVTIWQFLIRVWTYVIGLSCLLRTILEYEKVRQVWTLQYGLAWKRAHQNNSNDTPLPMCEFRVRCPLQRINSNVDKPWFAVKGSRRNLHIGCWVSLELSREVCSHSRGLLCKLVWQSS